MHRLIVALLAAFDAAIAAAVGLAAALAPLTLVFVFAMGGTADWGTLWPASGTVWQFGHLVPLTITLPGEYLADAGIDRSAASFVISLAPLAFATFTAIFAARSGVRASRADEWVTGVVVGSAVFAGIAVGVWTTTGNEVAAVEAWQAIVLPSVVFAAPALVAAVVTEWREAGAGVVARLRDRVEAAAGGWGVVPGLIARATAVAVAGLVGVGALAVAVALIMGAGEVIALFQAGHVDGLGVVTMTLAQLAYLPTLLVWGLSFVAGPGFSLGVGTAVSPAGTLVGVLPPVPVLGAVPETSSSFLLLLALSPVAVGALAGWIARSRTVPRTAPLVEHTGASADDAERSAALAALLGDTGDTQPVEPLDDAHHRRAREGRADAEPAVPRLVITLGIAVLTAAAAGLLAAAASGSLGPGRLAAEVGPDPGPVALAVGLEVFAGAAILLLSPRPAGRSARRAKKAEATDAASEAPHGPQARGGEASVPLTAAVLADPHDDLPTLSPELAARLGAVGHEEARRPTPGAPAPPPVGDRRPPTLPPGTGHAGG
ncbi:DUF6350 family protein [Microbacterium sp. BWT-B31]|uniref:cell division protein PerM n=1 Tax=Microbacterium sp. BWT-B31 TaxID=3232072 RepID=UPI0035290543